MDKVGRQYLRWSIKMEIYEEEVEKLNEKTYKQ